VKRSKPQPPSEAARALARARLAAAQAEAALLPPPPASASLWVKPNWDDDDLDAMLADKLRQEQIAHAVRAMRVHDDLVAATDAVRDLDQQAATADDSAVRAQRAAAAKIKIDARRLAADQRAFDAALTVAATYVGGVPARYKDPVARLWPAGKPPGPARLRALRTTYQEQALSRAQVDAIAAATPHRRVSLQTLCSKAATLALRPVVLEIYSTTPET